MTTYKTLAIVDDVNACDCCGKTNLKSTVAMESSDGEIVHFGSVCATRHTGRDLPAIKREAREEYDRRVAAARAEFASTPEHLAHGAKLAQARRANIPTGRAFKEFHVVEQAAANAKRAEIAARHGVEPYAV